MCVIIHCSKVKPSLEILQACAIANSAGAGLAWFKEGKVHWQKGLNAEGVHELLKDATLPAVIHFRLATVGGVCDELCHPFPISEKSETFKAGSIDESAGVLFHNGHVHDWELFAIAAGVDNLPGKVSDTRAIAATVSRCDLRLLKKLPGVFAVMRDGKVIRFGSWDKHEGIHYSNLHWKWRMNTSNVNVSAKSSPGKFRDYSHGDDYFYWGQYGSPGPIGFNQSGDNGLVWNRETQSFDKKAEEPTPANGNGGLSPLIPDRYKDLAPESHHPDCNCPLCRAAKYHKDDCLCLSCRTNKENREKRREIFERLLAEKKENEILEIASHHSDACECNDCVQAAIIQTKREQDAGVGRTPEPHGSDCRCHQCRQVFLNEYMN